MAEGRMLRKKASRDDRLGQLSANACLLYLLSIPHLDVEGRMDGDPAAVRGTVAACRRRHHPGQWTDELVESYIAEWTRTVDVDGHQDPLVAWYEVAGVRVCEFLGFKKNQRLQPGREAPSRFPAPPGDLLSLVAPRAVAATDAVPDEPAPDAVQGPFGDPLFEPSPAVAAVPDADSGAAPEQVAAQAEAEAQDQEPPADQRGPSRARGREIRGLAALQGEDHLDREDPLAAAVLAGVERRRGALETHGPLSRLLEVLPDMDAQTPAVLHALFDPLGAEAIERARDEIVSYGPEIRRPSAYAVGIGKRLALVAAGVAAPRKRRGARRFASLADEVKEIGQIFVSREDLERRTGGPVSDEQWDRLQRPWLAAGDQPNEGGA